MDTLSPPPQGKLLPRPAKEKDLSQIAAIEEESYPSPWPEDFFRRCLAAGFDTWVISSSDQVQSYAVMSVGGGVGHLMNICVHAAARRQGLGRIMLRHLLLLARKRHCGLFLEVRESNQAPQSLYQNGGLQILGLRKDYYGSGIEREDAVVMGYPWSSLSA